MAERIFWHHGAATTTRDAITNSLSVPPTAAPHRLADDFRYNTNSFNRLSSSAITRQQPLPPIPRHTHSAPTPSFRHLFSAFNTLYTALANFFPRAHRHIRRGSCRSRPKPVFVNRFGALLESYLIGIIFSPYSSLRRKRLSLSPSFQNRFRKPVWGEREYIWLWLKGAEVIVVENRSTWPSPYLLWAENFIRSVSKPVS